MCGLFGITNFADDDLNRARQSLHTLHHRGPDQWNDFHDQNIYMGHQRLSILDLSENGEQPMISPCGNVIISVNGEIYNFRELKVELEQKHTFKSSSDSEVILFGYIEWGLESLLKKIDGMYAISIYDKKNSTVYLARDRCGIKPLYFSQIDNQICWASELKAIEKYHNKLSIDYTSLYDFLTYRYIPTPKTMYESVSKLEPAHFLAINLSTQKTTTTCYWRLNPKSTNISINEAKEKIYELVEKSIEEQMVSDVPVGFFLSGGIDSSSVVGIAAKNHKNINTFSIGFTDKKHDETHYSDMVSKQYQTKHHKKILNPTDVKNLFPKIKTWYDEPFGDSSCFPTYMVSKYAKENVTVVLTGDGGDEVFGGYNWYKSFERFRRFNIKPLPSTKALVNKLSSRRSFIGKIASRLQLHLFADLELYTKIMGGLLKEQKSKYKKLWNIPDDYDDYWYYRKFYRDDLDIFTRLQYLDFHTFMHDDVLTKVDRVSMDVSLECRVPLLSKDIIEFAFSLPTEIRLHKGELKGAMKEAFTNTLPPEIINRDKKGFSIPLKAWKSELMNDEDTLQEKILKELYAIEA